ncbi:MAG TPA: DUF3098 domain-containing protein [Chitinophagales bacterium]|nr:DUF3098 domain-containing protein [Chitinophagales bacterium]HNM32979.1 DUF3098 domain-containing protein [Chitinophagales bacterium]
MAKNQPIKTTPTAKAPKATVRNTTSAKTSSGSWLRFPTSQNTYLLFDKTNYILLAVGGIFIILGFILMSGGNTDPKVFNAAEIYSFRRITLAPITVLIGFAIVAIAILKKPSDTNKAI